MARFGSLGFRRVALSSLVFVLAACAGFDGRNLEPGESTLPDVIASMGEPAMRWKDPDGRAQLAYPRGPAATQTFMVFTDPDGRLERIEPVLDMAHFARVTPRKSNVESVIRLLGPVTNNNRAYFKERDELALSWLYCDAWSKQSYFDVLFDATTGIVRTTFHRLNLVGSLGVQPGCGH